MTKIATLKGSKRRSAAFEVKPLASTEPVVAETARVEEKPKKKGKGK